MVPISGQSPAPIIRCTEQGLEIQEKLFDVMGLNAQWEPGFKAFEWERLRADGVHSSPPHAPPAPWSPQRV